MPRKNKAADKGEQNWREIFSRFPQPRLRKVLDHAVRVVADTGASEPEKASAANQLKAGFDIDMNLTLEVLAEIRGAKKEDLEAAQAQSARLQTDFDALVASIQPLRESLIGFDVIRNRRR